MKPRTLTLFGGMFFYLLFFAGNAISQVVSVTNGSWTSPSTWSTGVVPGAGDDVIVRHDVTFSGSSTFSGTVNSLTIENGTNNIDATVSFNNGTATRSLHILTNLVVTATTGYDCRFQAQGANTSITVDGDLLLTRDHSGAGLVFGIRLRYGSSMTATNLQVYYFNSADDNQEVYLRENSTMILSGDVLFISTGGLEEISLDVVDDAYFECGNLEARLEGSESPDGVGRDIELRIWDNGQAVVRGNCTMTRTGGRKIDITLGNSSSGAASWLVEGDLYLQHLNGLDHSLKYLTIEAEGQSSLTVNGNVTAISNSERRLEFEFHDNSKLDINGDFYLQGSTNSNVEVNAYNTAQFFFGGDIIMNFPSFPNPNCFFFSSSGSDISTVTFDGTANQTVPGLETYGNLIIDNPTRVTLTGNITVNNQLSLLNGKMWAPAMKVTLPLNAGITGSSTGYICNGTLSRALNSGGPYWFYLGDTTKGYSPVVLNTLSSSSTYEVTYYPVGAGTVGPPGPYPTTVMDPTLQVVSSLEYWNINRVSGSGTADVTLGWNAYSGVGNSAFSDLRIARWNGAQWSNQGDCTTSGDSSAGVIRTISAVPGFGPFTLSSLLVGIHILPAGSFTNFSAQPEKGRVKLTWEAANETGTRYYIVERSGDGLQYTPIAKVYAAKAGDKTFYKQYDEQPLDCKSYYRLRQVASNGKEELSKAVSINGFTTGAIRVIPGSIAYGTHASIQLRLPSCTEGPVQLQVYDINGRPRYIKSLENSGGKVRVSLQEAGLNRGIYLIRLQFTETTVTSKFIIY